MNASIVLLPGDGIGPEIVREARKVLEAVASAHRHTFEFTEKLIGGIAIDETGDPLPQSTLDACLASDAVILGAVGGPKWSDPAAKTRPEAGLLAVRRRLGLFANIRPIVARNALIGASPLKASLVDGVDILMYRELTGGIYFGGSTASDDGTTVADSMRYSVGEIERIVRLAAEGARSRSGRLTSVDKANVLAVSRLWRKTTERVVQDEFPDLTLEHQLVDAMAMHLVTRPKDFDVIVTGNLFGDILSDEASVLPGSLGMLPSASLGASGPGLYEPIHGSAPDIAGRGIANPLGTILSAALALRHSLGLAAEADAVEDAVDAVLDGGLRTADIADGGRSVGTADMGDAVVEALR